MARLVACCVLFFAATASAQGTPLYLSFDPSIEPAAQAAMRTAIAAELHATLVEQPADGVPVLHVARAADGQLALTLRQNPLPVLRSLPWNDDVAVIARDAALMAKNLVLDQTAELLEPPSAAAPRPQPPAPPPAPQASDTEQPPGFARAPLRVDQPSAPREGARIMLIGAVNPALAVEVSAPGASGSARTFSYGVHARADAPLGDHLAAGGGIALTTWGNDDYYEHGYGLDHSPAVITTIVMDASAHLRALVPLGTRAQLYAQLGAGPSTYSVMGVDDGVMQHSVTPYLGMNAALVAGASLRFTRQLGALLEVGPSYHFMHGRDIAGDRVRVHAIQLAVQLGALWVFDAY